MKKVINFIILVILLSCSPDKEPVIYTNINNKSEWSVRELVLLDSVNSYRLANNLNALKIAKLNWDLALERNLDNTLIDGISHLGYNKVILAREKAGLESSAEMLGYRYTDPAGMMFGWKRSEPHNKKLLEPKWKYTGISIYTDSITNYKYYCQILTY